MAASSSNKRRLTGYYSDSEYSYYSDDEEPVSYYSDDEEPVHNVRPTLQPQERDALVAASCTPPPGQFIVSTPPQDMTEGTSLADRMFRAIELQERGRQEAFTKMCSGQDRNTEVLTSMVQVIQTNQNMTIGK